MQMVHRENSSDRLLAVAWVLAVVSTIITAGLAVELADHTVRVIQGVLYSLPYRVNESVRLIVLYGVLFVIPATICRLSWSYLYRHTDAALVTTAVLLHIMVLSVSGPALLARRLGDFFGR